ncbi:MAG: hypothetical protein ACXAC7_06575 [Candidatus Hodarchaeales archaeon]|jgi:hypothetical protein
MGEIIFSIFDPTTGPTPLYYSEGFDDSLAKKVAVKSQLTLSMEKQDIVNQDAVLPFPDINKIAFIFLFKVPGKEGPVMASLSYMVDQSLQMDLYKQVPVLKRRSLVVAHNLAKNYEYELKKDLDKEFQTMIITLFSDIPPYRVGLKGIKTSLSSDKSTDLAWLMKNFRRDIDKLFYTLFLGHPIILAGHRIMIEQVMSALELVGKELIKLPYIEDFIDPVGFDLIGVPVNLASKYEKIYTTVMNLEKSRVEGGITSKHLQSILNDIKDKDQRSAERQLAKVMAELHNELKLFSEACSEGNPGIPKAEKVLFGLEESHRLFLKEITLTLNPGVQSILDQLE